MDGFDKGPVIGQGTYGSVYRATNCETGCIVAIKKVNASSRPTTHITRVHVQFWSTSLSFPLA